MYLFELLHLPSLDNIRPTAYTITHVDISSSVNKMLGGGSGSVPLRSVVAYPTCSLYYPHRVVLEIRLNSYKYDRYAGDYTWIMMMIR